MKEIFARPPGPPPPTPPGPPPPPPPPAPGARPPAPPRRPRRAPVHYRPRTEIDEQTTLGHAYVRSLMRSQLR
ncbi:hypothetical protein OK074_9076, partial [Actinobacteria bacterium OK074]